jgi:hypothetical protein
MKNITLAWRPTAPGRAFADRPELIGSPDSHNKRGNPMAASSVALVWYLVIAGPQGGMVVLPSTFDTREQCAFAVTEYQKQPTPAGWSVQCVPSASPFADEGESE